MRFACAFTLFSPGQTHDVNAIRRLSGNHLNAATPVAWSEMRIASPPSDAIT
jgi:hypothetical protein